MQDPIFTVCSGNTRNREGGNKKVANIQANNHKFIQILFYTNMNEFLQQQISFIVDHNQKSERRTIMLQILMMNFNKRIAEASSSLLLLLNTK